MNRRAGAVPLDELAAATGCDPRLVHEAGEAALRQVVREVGCGRFRCATATPSFMVLEARP